MFAYPAPHYWDPSPAYTYPTPAAYFAPSSSSYRRPRASAHNPVYFLDEHDDYEQDRYSAYVEALRRQQMQKEQEEREARRQAQEAAYIKALMGERQRQREMQRREHSEQERIRRMRNAYEDELSRHLASQLPNTRKTKRSPSPPVKPAQSTSASPSAVTPIPIMSNSDASAAVQPIPSPSTQSKMKYDEAVAFVQGHLKRKLSIRKREKALQAIQERFAATKASFEMPETLAFDMVESKPDQPVLAYEAINRPVHAYEETLVRLLTELDNISSEGSQRIKGERKALVVSIEQELERIDQAKLEKWRQQQEASPSALENEASEIPDTNANDKAEGVMDVQPTTEQDLDGDVLHEAKVVESIDQPGGDMEIDQSMDASNSTPTLDETPIDGTEQVDTLADSSMGSESDGRSYVLVEAPPNEETDGTPATASELPQADEAAEQHRSTTPALVNDDMDTSEDDDSDDFDAHKLISQSIPGVPGESKLDVDQPDAHAPTLPGPAMEKAQSAETGAVPVQVSS